MADFHFLEGHLFDDNLLYVTAIREDYEDENKKHTYVLKRSHEVWSRSFVNNRLQSFVTYSGSDGRTLLALANDGEIVRGTPGGAVRGQVDPSEDGPSDLRHIIRVQRIGDTLFACGMRRQLYRCDLDGLVWQRVDSGMFDSDGDRASGLWGVAGPASDRLVAVGLNGEVWCFRNEAWRRSEASTHADLHAITMWNEHTAIICGARGTVLTGWDERWRAIDNGGVGSDFWDVAVFQDRIWLAGGRNGLFMVENDTVVAAKLPDRMLAAVSSLDVVGGKMLLVGDQQVVLFDGQTWRDLKAPLT